MFILLVPLLKQELFSKVYLTLDRIENVLYCHLQMSAGEVNSGKLKPLKFDWDKYNQFKNWEKHRVAFRECEQVFFNRPINFLYDKKHSQKEERFVALGVTDDGRKLIIVFTIRNRKIRIVSARDQSRRERRLYEQKE